MTVGAAIAGAAASAAFGYLAFTTNPGQQVLAADPSTSDPAVVSTTKRSPDATTDPAAAATSDPNTSVGSSSDQSTQSYFGTGRASSGTRSHRAHAVTGGS
jgi:hypothetical protein